MTVLRAHPPSPVAPWAEVVPDAPYPMTTDDLHALPDDGWDDAISPETTEGRRHRDAAVRWFLAHRPAVGSLVSLLVLVALTASAGVLPLSDPTAGDPYHQDSLPTPTHLLGSDDAGHDLLSALIFGLRPALAVGAAGQVVATVLGLLVGVVAGVYGGWADALLSRLTDVFFALPTFLLGVLLVALAFVGDGLRDALDPRASL